MVARSVRSQFVQRDATKDLRKEPLLELPGSVCQVVVAVAMLVARSRPPSGTGEVFRKDNVRNGHEQNPAPPILADINRRAR